MILTTSDIKWKNNDNKKEKINEIIGNESGVMMIFVIKELWTTQTIWIWICNGIYCILLLVPCWRIYLWMLNLTSKPTKISPTMLNVCCSIHVLHLQIFGGIENSKNINKSKVLINRVEWEMNYILDFNSFIS